MLLHRVRRLRGWSAGLLFLWDFAILLQGGHPRTHFLPFLPYLTFTTTILEYLGLLLPRNVNELTGLSTKVHAKRFVNEKKKRRREKKSFWMV